MTQTKGVAAAKICKPRLEKWRKEITEATQKYGFEPSLLAALCCRETSVLDMYVLPPPKGKLGDGGAGHGPCQIDIKSFPDWCKDWRDGKLTVADAFMKGASVLTEKKVEITKMGLAGTDASLLLRMTLAAYNCGAGNVKKCVKAKEDIDTHTTGKDYSADTLVMAQWLKENGWQS